MKRFINGYVQILRKIPATAMIVFVVSVVCMNLLANKSITLPVEWLALDCGIIMSGLSFLAMDVIVIQFGPRVAFKTSVFTTLVNLVVAGMFKIASIIPGVWGESFVQIGGELINTALDNTFGGTWFIIAGSTLAFLASSGVNVTLNHLIGRVTKEGTRTSYYLRCYVSTVIAQFIDNMIFALVVSHNFFGWSLIQCVTCSLTGAVLELIFEAVFSPIGYKICQDWKKNGIGGSINVLG